MIKETVIEERALQKRRRVATLFRRLATQLGRGELVTVDDAQSVAVDVPPEVDVSVELEREGETASLEFEL